MDFKDLIKQLAERVEKLKESIQTEEATKNALIMPFIQALGYDVFNPLEVVPEMDCDLVKKKGDKVDYSIMLNGEPIMLIECKHWKQDLALHDNQLQKYYAASKAKFGVLTNGVIYRFYTDLEKVNIMDANPFLELNLEDYKDVQVEELKKFHKSYFDIDTILSSASELKYMIELKNILKREFTSPSPELVRYFAKQAYEGVITSKILEQFTVLVKHSISNYVNDTISNKLNIAINNTGPTQSSEIADESNTPSEPASKIITTEEEIEGFFILKSILRNVIEASRITYRDTQSYFGVLIDDNNRKAICRLYLNSPTNKQLAIINEAKQEVKYKIENLDELYNYSEQLIEEVKRFI